MEEKRPEETQLIKTEEISLEKMSLEQKRQAERIYQQLGLDPVVDKVLKEFPEYLSGMDRVTDKVFGPYDIKGRAETVAKVTALITYAALSEQYNKEIGNFQSQIESLGGERDQVRANYDNLVEKVADIVGGDYEELKTNYNQLVDRLAKVEQLRSQVADLNKEKAELMEGYESQAAAQKKEHDEQMENLRAQIADRDSKLEGLESGKAAVTAELDQSRANYEQLTTSHQRLEKEHDKLKTAIATISQAMPYEEIRKKLARELHAFLLKDSKVPNAVIDGVGKFINFEKYLGIAAETGAEEACKRTEEMLRNPS